MKLLKALLLSVAILSLFSVLGAQAPAWLWAESVGSGETGSLEVFNLRGQLVAGYQLSSGAHETLL